MPSFVIKCSLGGQPLSINNTCYDRLRKLDSDSRGPSAAVSADHNRSFEGAASREIRPETQEFCRLLAQILRRTIPDLERRTRKRCFAECDDDAPLASHMVPAKEARRRRINGKGARS